MCIRDSSLSVRILRKLDCRSRLTCYVRRSPRPKGYHEIQRRGIGCLCRPVSRSVEVSSPRGLGLFVADIVASVPRLQVFYRRREEVMCSYRQQRYSATAPVLVRIEPHADAGANFFLDICDLICYTTLALDGCGERNRLSDNRKGALSIGGARHGWIP